jgi:aminoglycoside phosphotransferase (APT) family kinase protein
VVFSRRVDGRAGIDANLVRRLVATQFPHWRDEPVTPVDVDGWDNRTYRLGDRMTVRLPTHDRYTAAVEKEHRWLPILAPALPVPIPVPLALGSPAEGYPHRWSIRQWIEGEPVSLDRVADPAQFALAVADFILALQSIDATGGPPAGVESFYRGASLAHYDIETQEALERLRGHLDTAHAARVWDAALASTWPGPPIWFHGDIAHGNLLVRDGELAAVIDFGTFGVGDPACDLVIAFTLFTGKSREAFRTRVQQDRGMWARARGWALWKALITLAADIGTDPEAAAVNRTVIHEVLADHDAAG